MIRIQFQILVVSGFLDICPELNLTAKTTKVCHGATNRMLCGTITEFINHSLLSHLKSIVCTMQVTVIFDFGYLINTFCVPCLHIKKKNQEPMGKNGHTYTFLRCL